MADALQVETFLPFTTVAVQVLAKLDGTLTEMLAVVPFSTAVAFAAALATTGGLAFGDAAGAELGNTWIKETCFQPDKFPARSITRTSTKVASVITATE